MSVVVNQSGAWKQGSSWIGYDSFLLRDGVVLAANVEDVGQPGSNAADWLTYSGGWQATGAGDKTLTATLTIAENANSMGIYKHNLGTLGLTAKLQYSSDGSTWNDLTGTEISPADDTAIFMVAAAPVSAQFWRIHIAGLASAETLIIGQAYVGDSMQVFSPPESGFTPPNMGLANKYITSRSDGGDFLGRSLIRKGYESAFNIQNVAASWVRSDWMPFLLEAEKHPFYYSWDSLSHPTEVAFCYVGKKIAPPKYQSSLLFGISLKFTALID